MSFIKVKCKGCNKIYTIECIDFSWELDHSSPREMGRENLYIAEYGFDCECGGNVTIIFECWEYPEGSINHTDQKIDGGDIIEDKCEKCPKSFRFIEKH